VKRLEENPESDPEENRNFKPAENRQFHPGADKQVANLRRIANRDTNRLTVLRGK
jgi:hypothetical protein